MTVRLLSLLLVALFGWTSAGSVARPIAPRDPLTRSISAGDAPTVPAIRKSDNGQLLRALPRSTERHPASHEAGGFDVPPVYALVARGAVQSAAGELRVAYVAPALTFPYDATAPPGQ